MLEDSKYIRKGDDLWVPTVCFGCYNCCSIKAHRVNGKIVDIAGDPESPNSMGYLCAKGKSRFLDMYHPNRVQSPLIRTNPNKGPDEDPGWKEISWDEALESIVEKLKKIREDDPRKLILGHFDLPGYRLSMAFGMAFGTPNMHWNRADVCGSASHPAWLITNGTLNSEIDFEHCTYIVLWGTQLGHLVNTMPFIASSQLAEARMKGAKLVVIDPFCSNAAAKADEWIPIKPGTDGALALAILNVMANELEIYDVEFLKTQTNGVYLIDEEGHYLRHPENQKPVLWDQKDNRLKTFDSDSLFEPALEGTFEVEGKKVQPAFQVLKDHLKQFDVHEMASITTVPAETIRRIAEEFCKAAQIGATIEIDGHTLPLRPAGIDFKRGVAMHKGGFNSCMAIHLINILVGAIDVPGGQRGVNPRGPYWQPDVSDDGLLIPADLITKYNKPYPGSKPKIPEIFDLREIFPAALFTRGLFPWGIDEAEKFGIDYRPEMLIHGRTNLMMNSHNPKAMAETLRKIPFIVSINTMIDETTEMADIVLPDTYEYERWDMFPANDPYAFVAAGPGDWYWLARQPVVEPPPLVRPWAETYLEIAKRLGILDELYQKGNSFWLLNEEDKLEKGKEYTIRDIAERQARYILGDDFDWEKLTHSSAIISRKKTIEEAYPRMFFKSRIPIYFEYLLELAKDVKKITDQVGLEWDFKPYSPLPLYIPCTCSDKEESQYDLLVTNHKLPFHTFSVSSENIWINEISMSSPYAYKVLLNTSVALKKNLKDGDHVVVETLYGKTEGVVKVTELLHPDCVGMAGTFGHWARKLPTAKNKGASFTRIQPPPALDRIDTLTGQIDMCVKAKVSKIEEH